MAAEKIIRISVCARCGMTFEPKRTIQGKFCSLWCARRGKSAKDYRQKIHNGRIRHVHRLRAEAALGRPLPHGAIVHHVDGTKSETSQLVICPSQYYHCLLHRRMRVKAAGGNPNTDAICCRCKLVLPLTDFWRNKTAAYGHHLMCRPCAQARRHAHSTKPL